MLPATLRGQTGSTGDGPKGERHPMRLHPPPGSPRNRSRPIQSSGQGISIPCRLHAAMAPARQRLKIVKVKDLCVLDTVPGRASPLRTAMAQRRAIGCVPDCVGGSLNTQLLTTCDPLEQLLVAQQDQPTARVIAVGAEHRGSVRAQRVDGDDPHEVEPATGALPTKPSLLEEPPALRGIGDNRPG